MRFLAPALKVLGPLYRPQGGLVTTDRIDLEGSVQLVHDVSREAELASAIGVLAAPGYQLLGTAHAHAGADTVYSSYNPGAVVASGTTYAVPATNEFNVWWLGSFAYSPAAIADLVWTSAIYFPPLPGQLTQMGCLLNGGNTLVPFSDLAATGASYTSVDIGRDTGYQRSPMLIPRGSLLNHRSYTATASTINIIDRVWSGPTGVLPPGLA